MEQPGSPDGAAIADPRRGSAASGLADMFYVYILKSESTGRYYKGSTNDLHRRMGEHQRGKDHATKSGGPWKLVHVEQYQTRKEAAHREKYLKSLKSREAIQKIIRHAHARGVEQPGSSPGP